MCIRALQEVERELVSAQETLARENKDVLLAAARVHALADEEYARKRAVVAARAVAAGPQVSLLYWYKSANTDAAAAAADARVSEMSARAEVKAERVKYNRAQDRHERAEAGTHFTCFTSTKVQILTSEEQRWRRCCPRSPSFSRYSCSLYLFY